MNADRIMTDPRVEAVARWQWHAGDDVATANWEREWAADLLAVADAAAPAPYGATFHADVDEDDVALIDLDAKGQETQSPADSPSGELPGSLPTTQVADKGQSSTEGQEPAAEPIDLLGALKASLTRRPTITPGCVNCGHEKSSHGEYLSMTQPPVKTECYYRSCRCTLFSPAAEGAGGEESGH